MAERVGRALTILGYTHRAAVDPSATPSYDVLVACDRPSVGAALASTSPEARRPVLALVKASDADAFPFRPGPYRSDAELLRALTPFIAALDDIPAAHPAPAAAVATPVEWEGVTVVLFVGGPPEGAERSLLSLLRETSAAYKVIVAAGNPVVTERLTRTIARNPRAQIALLSGRFGLAEAMNFACRQASGDVVLLSSGVELPERWLTRLSEVAYSRQDVATVSPLSDTGSFAIVPPGQSQTTVDEEVRRRSPKLRPRAPLGEHACLYIRRSALEAVGSFDEFAFPGSCAGAAVYDFCLRATALGFANIVDDALFVSGASTAVHAPDARADATLERLHPLHAAAMRDWRRSDPLGGVRNAIQRNVGGESPPVVLFVHHAGGGGTPQTNADLMRSLDGRYRPLVLRCGLDRWTMQDSDGNTLRTWAFTERWRPRDAADAERAAAFVEALHQAEPAIVHVRSLLAFAPEFLRAAKAANAALVVSFHDFYAVCPTIQLLDQATRYCAGSCTPGPGICKLSTFWFGDSMKDLKHDYVHEWRRRMADGFDVADALVTTSVSARAVVTEHFGATPAPVRVIPHGRDLGRFRRVGRRPGPGVQRVVAFGALGEAKGVRLLAEVLRLNEERGGRFEFHFVGELHGGFKPERWGGLTHGPYARENLPAILDGIAPNYAAVTSIWPETYCHTLTEAWASGLPVFASDIGTLRERLVATPGGWLLDYRDPLAWYDAMCETADAPERWDAAQAAIAAIAPRTVDDMAKDYAELYASLMSAVPETRT